MSTPLLLQGSPAWNAGHPHYSGSLEGHQPGLSPAECVWLFHRLTEHPLERNRKWMKGRREWALHALMKSTHIIHQVCINNTCISVCSRIWASSIHASTSSGYCSVTFFKCPWKTAEDNYATSMTHSLSKKMKIKQRVKALTLERYTILQKQVSKHLHSNKSALVSFLHYSILL